ncbi:MAG: SBBP repeat-containing protein [Proteobacteria bacterium]|nr:SBBP repeat-containing protein [Pseudomonadota bacterium]
MYGCVRVTSRIILSGALLAGMTGLWAKSALAKSPDAPPIPSYAKMALTFEINRGQTDSEVRFLSRGSGYTLFLTPDEAVLALSKPARDAQRPRARRTPRPGGGAIERTVLRMRFIGANPNPVINGVQKLRAKSNYFIGKDRAKWRTNVPHYAKVRYTDVYPGIDLVFYGTEQRHLEYDFIVAPGADASVIALGFEGAKRVEIDAKGDLVLHTDGGKVRQHKPIVYQEVAGVRKEIGGAYVIRGANRIGFKVSAYDKSKPLIIDPVLSYATYLGGSGNDRINSIAVQPGCDTEDPCAPFVAGSTTSADFPGAMLPEHDVSGGDAFVAKFTADGLNLVYATYIGGGGVDGDIATDITVDANGNAYVTGYTDSDDFPIGPIPGAFDTDCGVDGDDVCDTTSGGTVLEDAFVAKLDGEGALAWATYLGGSGGDFGLGIALDAAGNPYVAGWTSSLDFPTTVGAFPPYAPLQNRIRGYGDAFVTKLEPNGTGLVYSHYLSFATNPLLQPTSEFVGGIAVDAAGSAYVVGTVAFSTAHLQWGERAAVAMKLNAVGSDIEYGKILGGNRDDYGYAISVDDVGNAYLTGSTNSPDFPNGFSVSPDFIPLEDAFQNALSGGKKCQNQACPPDAFIVKLDLNGALVYRTYFGGKDRDEGFSIAIDTTGTAHFTGRTYSTRGFPTLNAFQPDHGGALSDAFAAKLRPVGDGSNDLIYSTYIGGSGNDIGLSITLDDAGNAYVAGNTNSADFPTVAPFQNFLDGQSDAFVAKISEQPGSGDPPVGCSDFTLTANGYKVKGKQKADLEWCGAGSTNVDILRDGAGISTTANDGFYTDNIDQKGGGTYIYQICETGTAICSNEATVTF